MRQVDRIPFKAHPTKYSDVMFRSRLEARWAAFFDLCEFEWQYEPVDLDGWTPDFYLKFPCGHSSCGGYHSLFVEVKPYSNIAEFAGHQCMTWAYGLRDNASYTTSARLGADGAAGFGLNPDVTTFEIAHGDGGGQFDLPFFTHKNTAVLWKEAGNIVQWCARNANNPQAKSTAAAELYLGSKPPMWWLAKAHEQGGAALPVGIGLWFKLGLQKGSPAPIRVDTALRQSMGLSSDQTRRGLHALERAGLVRVHVGGRGRCAQVTLINTQAQNDK